MNMMPSMDETAEVIASGLAFPEGPVALPEGAIAVVEMKTGMLTGHLGIRVNVVAPGYVRTPRMVDRFPPETWEELAAATPLGRVGVPADIAGPLLFLTSDLPRYATGQVLVADDGIVLPIRAMAAPARAQIGGRRGRPA